MNATINCIDTQYFIRVGPDGRYRLTGLPEGTYEIQVYHPDLPLVSEIVDIKSGDSNTINFTLSR